MPKFYVIVSQLKLKGELQLDRCGFIDAPNRFAAEIAVEAYRDKLNPGSLDWMGQDYFIVCVMSLRYARRMSGFDEFKRTDITTILP